jgi:class I fructose-bisphosphate aldolase
MARAKENPSQAVTASVQDALRLGCAAIGFTIYPGSDEAYTMMEEIAEMGREAKSCGLAVVIWSYPRGGNLSKNGETAIDICAYAAHIAAQLGAHIIKVKPPTEFLELDAAKKVYEQQKIDISTPAKRIAHVVQSCFAGKRIVVFSGGEAKDLDGVYNEARAIRDGGGNGSIIGRNTFQRPREDALKMLDHIIRIYRGEA